MPTLLQINTSVNSGSTGRIAEQIGTFVQDHNWNSYIAYGRRNNNSRSTVVKIGNAADIGFHLAMTRLLDRHGLASKKATINFLKEIIKIKPDIIHLHNIHGYFINYPALFKFLDAENIPVVWTLHDCWPFTGHCSYFSDIRCTKWQTQCQHCPKLSSYPASLWVDRSYENFNQKRQFFEAPHNITMVAVSDWLCEIIKESFLGNMPLRKISNGIDLDTFAPRLDNSEIRSKYGVKKRYMILGVASVWDRRKGYDDYIRLAGALSDDYDLVLVGLTPKQISYLPNNVTGIKRTEDLNELSALYSSADIVLNLSNQETFGLTTVEGFACGTPGIVYNCTASPELITHQTGLVVEERNIQELTQAIERIILKGKAYYRNNCRKMAEQKYPKEGMLNGYMQLYNQIIDKA